MADNSITQAGGSSLVIGDHPRTRRRTWGFRFSLLMIAWICVEGAAWLLLHLLLEGGVKAVRLHQESYRFADSHSPQQAQPSMQTQTFHPYVGWVRNPEIVKGEDYWGTHLTTSRYGFLDTTEGIHTRGPDRLIVGISGGSMAFQMSCAGADVLRRTLKEVPAFRDREIIIVRLAQSAYKQPQALFSLNYYLLLGAEFDIVINLDGYNEIALAAAENFPLHVAIDYPQGWFLRTLDFVDPRDADVSLRVFEIRGMRRRNALAALRSPWRFLPTHCLLWYSREVRLRQELVDQQIGLSDNARQRGGAFIHTGPHPRAVTTDAALVECVRIWKQSSLQMHRLCEASDILYVHAIQPNQHDPGSKPLTDKEQEMMLPGSANNAHRMYAPLIPLGYPKLRDAGRALREAGVRNIDLTQLFAQTSESLYVDSCCHVNPTGSEMLAAALAEYVVEQLPE